MIGIYCTDTELKGMGKKGYTHPLESGVVVQGVIQDVEAFSKALKEVSKNCGGTTLSLCLPPESTYCVAINPENLEKEIPEDSANLHYTMHSVGKKEVSSIIAVRKDLLAGYKEACKTAKLHLKHVTTLSLGCMHLAKKNSLIVSHGVHTFGNILQIQKGHPIDEHTFPAKVTEKKLLEKIVAILTENPALQTVVVLGTNALVESCKEACKELRKVHVVPALTWKNDTDTEYAGAHVALKSTGKLNLLRLKKRRFSRKLFLALLFTIVACAGVVAYLRPDLVQQTVRYF